MKDTYSSIDEAMQMHEDIIRELRQLRSSVTILDWMLGTSRYKRMLIVHCQHIEMMAILSDFAFGLFPIQLEKQINLILKTP